MLMKLLQLVTFIVIMKCSSTVQYCIAVEKKTIDTFAEILAFLIATYFVFNIQYPKQFYVLLLFLQHNYSYELDWQSTSTNNCSQFCF